MISSARITKRLLVAVGVVVAAGATALELLPPHNSTRAPQTTTIVVANRGNIILSVGGVGRVVETRATGTIAVPVAAPPSTSGSTPGAPTTAPADAVFPTTAGRLVRFLVEPGRHVTTGEPVAVLDDGSASAIALAQAHNDAATAALELQQRRTSDPANGLPPTRAELAGARAAVRAARGRARLVAHPTAADVTSARLDVRKALSDLATLIRPPVPVSVAAARLAVSVATQKLEQVSGPASAVDVASAQTDLAKAQADLEALQALPPGPSVLALKAAQLAITLAQQRIAELPPGSPASDLTAAQLDLAKAQGELEALQRPAPPPGPAALAAAQAAVDLANRKLGLLVGPANAAAVASAQLDLQKARSDLVTLLRPPPAVARSAALLAVRLAHERLARLLHPTTADRDTATADVAKTVADLETLVRRGAPAGPIEIAIAQLKVQAADARIETARLQAARLTVRAPFPGTVTALLTAQGAPADPSTPIATIADLGHLSVSVDLSEFDIAKVHKGDRALLAVDALGGRRLPGHVSFVAPVGIDNGGVVTFPVRVSLTHSGALKPGMNVSVRIVVAERRNVVRVPLEAVSGHAVTVVGANGATAHQTVVLGLADNKQVQIRSGLRAGERVVLAPNGG